MKNTYLAFAASVCALSLAAPAAAQDVGSVQIKGFVTGVLPDGEIEEVLTDQTGLPAGSQTRATDSYVPTVALEYFVSPNFSLETICCVTPHDVRGAGALDGAELIDNAIILPATVTAKYHFDLSGGLKPYLGAGPTYFMIFSEDDPWRRTVAVMWPRLDRGHVDPRFYPVAAYRPARQGDGSAQDHRRTRQFRARLDAHDGPPVLGGPHGAAGF